MVASGSSYSLEDGATGKPYPSSKNVQHFAQFQHSYLEATVLNNKLSRILAAQKTLAILSLVGSKRGGDEGRSRHMLRCISRITNLLL